LLPPLETLPDPPLLATPPLLEPCVPPPSGRWNPPLLPPALLPPLEPPSGSFTPVLQLVQADNVNSRPVHSNER
jgi:hypothetical protein